MGTTFQEELSRRLGDSDFGASAGSVQPDAPPAEPSPAQYAIPPGTPVTVQTHVATDTLHIRTAPSTGAPILTSVANGSRLVTTGSAIMVKASANYPDGGAFYPVKLPNGAGGYAWAAYLVGPAIQPLPPSPVVIPWPPNVPPAPIPVVRPPTPGPVPVPPHVIGPPTPGPKPPTPGPTPGPTPIAAGVGWGWWAAGAALIAGGLAYSQRKTKSIGKL